MLICTLWPTLLCEVLCSLSVCWNWSFPHWKLDHWPRSTNKFASMLSGEGELIQHKLHFLNGLRVFGSCFGTCFFQCQIVLLFVFIMFHIWVKEMAYDILPLHLYTYMYVYILNQRQHTIYDFSPTTIQTCIKNLVVVKVTKCLLM